MIILGKTIYVTRAQVAAAKAIVERDAARGRTTPDVIKRLASVTRDSPALPTVPAEAEESS